MRQTITENLHSNYRFTHFSTAIYFVLLLVLSFSAFSQPTRLLRFPDIHQNSLTFVYAGDIYIADIKTGQSTRLTSHEGFETFPKFSRDGNKIAFSAEYSGSRQVYIMNTDGSELTQLTWYNDVGNMPPRGGFDYRILDWSSDNKNVLVRANRLPWGVRMGKPFWVPVDGGMPKSLAVPTTGGGMLSVDGKKYLYTPKDREFRTWKRYRGGRAQDVWVYDLENNSSEQLTTSPATDHQPVWVGEDIYFISDRNYTLNLFKYNANAAPTQVTEHKDMDALWASAGPASIVYENGGLIWRFDPVSQTSESLNIQIQGNRTHLLPQRKSVVDFIDSMAISPDGNRVAVAARGEIFSVPAKQGEIRQTTRLPESREMSVAWSPDGKHLSFLSDASGEYELYIQSQTNPENIQQLTTNGAIWRFAPVWSPNSQLLAFADKNQTLWVYDRKTKKTRSLDNSTRNDITDYAWSPDSRWVTYTKTEDNGFSSLWVYDLQANQALQLTDNTTNDFNPVFGTNGDYLYFLSNRDYNLSFSSYEFNYLYHNATRIYAAQLNTDSPAMYPYVSDEVNKTEEKVADKKKKTTVNPVTIEAQGFSQRTVALQSETGNYSNLQAHSTGVFALKQDNDTSQLVFVDTTSKQKKAVVLINKLNDYKVSDNGEKILISQGKKHALIKSSIRDSKKAVEAVKKNQLDLTHLTLRIDPTIEWKQMYVDGWRILRDWFYDPNIHGMDWVGIKQKYQPLADAAAHRTDLDYVFGEIAGELNAGHIYVNSGDQPKIKRKDNGLLGAELVRDESGYFQIITILPGENWHQNFRSPLSEPGVNAREGEYITHINGISTRSVNNIYQLLEHQADRTITMGLNSQAQEKGSRTVHLKPIKAEHSLRYLQWVQQRMQMVDKLSNGRIGYVHLPNTATDGNRELFKQFLPQITKDALIIDDRYNGGGFIPDRMIELLSRKTLNYWKFRGLQPNATPLIAHDGPKAMLINGLSSSGGDALPYYFRKNKLGPIIGTRTWGGLIGISGNPGLLDGGSILASTFRFLDTDGNWDVENVGVSPDIEVIDRPELLFAGKDPSLERAVEELLKGLESNPRKSIKAPVAPTVFK